MKIRKPTIIWLIVSLLLSIAVYSSTKQKPKQGSWVLGEKRTYGLYTFRSYGCNGKPGGYFEILRNGKRIYKRSGGNFTVDKVQGPGRLLIGRDINGDSQPDLVVSEFGRGAHGPYYSYIFEIGSRFRHIATIDGENDPVRFTDVDKDGRLEALLYDWTFAYWNASFAASPAPDVILEYRNGKYVFATDLMRKIVPNTKMIENAAQVSAAGLRKMEKYPNDQPPSELWEMMLDLIYTGHADVAMKFFEKTWPADVQGKQQFLNDFRNQLVKSPYWTAIKIMNNGGF